MQHTVKEFTLANDWLEAIRLASSQSAELYKSRATAIGVSEALSSLLRLDTNPPPDEIVEFMKRSVPFESAKLCLHVEKLNSLIGAHCGCRSGYRDAPLLVLTKNHPWASFFAPGFRAPEQFREQIGLLNQSYSVGCISREIYPIALILALLVCHPFVDGNGRTARVIFYSLLKQRLHLPDDRCLLYAQKLTGKNSHFVLALWEIRDNQNYHELCELFR
jgi:hypothetical protein